MRRPEVLTASASSNYQAAHFLELSVGGHSSKAANTELHLETSRDVARKACPHQPTEIPSQFSRNSPVTKRKLPNPTLSSATAQGSAGFCQSRPQFIDHHITSNRSKLPFAKPSADFRIGGMSFRRSICVRRRFAVSPSVSPRFTSGAELEW